MGDAVTGINRADTASGKLNGMILRQCSMLCNFSGYGAGGQPSACPRALSSPLTTDGHASLWRAAYPPPRESCVRGSDRASVDKHFRSPSGCHRIRHRSFFWLPLRAACRVDSDSRRERHSSSALSGTQISRPCHQLRSLALYRGQRPSLSGKASSLTSMQITLTTDGRPLTTGNRNSQPTALASALRHG